MACELTSTRYGLLVTQGATFHKAPLELDLTGDPRVRRLWGTRARQEVGLYRQRQETTMTPNAIRRWLGRNGWLWVGTTRHDTTRWTETTWEREGVEVTGEGANLAEALADVYEQVAPLARALPGIGGSSYERPR